MELQNLSNNWKNLQDKIKHDKAKPLKRKAPSVNHDRHWETRVRRHKDQKISRIKKSFREEIQGTMNIPTRIESGSSASLALWAEDNDISPADLVQAYGVSLDSTNVPGKYEDRINEGLSKMAEIGKYIAMDCEMVGVGDKDQSVLARVSIVNFHGVQVYDSYVRPLEEVTNWRTHVSGIQPKHMAAARSLAEVQKEVSDIMKDRILIGHALQNDFRALMFSHPPRDIRDTSRHVPFRKLSGGRPPALKKLAKELLGIDIQGGEHSSIEDARACMLLFRRHKDAFEVEHSQHAAASAKSSFRRYKSRHQKNGR